ncbi:hypothetical protein GCK72_006283 [Caenorhabditis remanei]|uniref:Uncharacterized protein n=1 Tax=Caenorhabditis remanei TaxID=31234 RepID=E3LR17_CAERE|nr:hypothetical protein GCK72_006283 [Caenorhabditis remanei]EFP07396.1 hypothetical protein CRE_26262 [Caenorhabditis remanei]KAF1766326.1 hypothetical protein GCK72_006283 [Caenorhabditis remanei]
MPAFTPLAATNEKNRPLDAIWSNEEDDEEQETVVEKRGIVAKLFNSSNAQHAKLLVLAVLALVHFYYLNDFLVKFAAVDEMSQDARYIKASGPNYAMDMASVRYTFQGFIDYKKNLWMTVGAMCASLATTASLLTIYSGPRDAFNRAAMIVIRVFDLCAFLFISFLLFARISSAVVINHTTQHSLRAASRISSNIVNDLANTLSCTVEPRDELPICSRQIIDSIFPVKLIEYLIILCLLTGAYIGLAYLIEWCIRHFFPPTHEKLTPISAISRNLVASSRCSSDNSVLIAA